MLGTWRRPPGLRGSGGRRWSVGLLDAFREVCEVHEVLTDPPRFGRRELHNWAPHRPRHERLRERVTLQRGAHLAAVERTAGDDRLWRLPGQLDLDVPGYAVLTSRHRCLYPAAAKTPYERAVASTSRTYGFGDTPGSA